MYIYIYIYVCMYVYQPPVDISSKLPFHKIHLQPLENTNLKIRTLGFHVVFIGAVRHISPDWFNSLLCCFNAQSTPCACLMISHTCRFSIVFTGFMFIPLSFKIWLQSKENSQETHNTRGKKHAIPINTIRHPRYL